MTLALYLAKRFLRSFLIVVVAVPRTIAIDALLSLCFCNEACIINFVCERFLLDRR